MTTRTSLQTLKTAAAQAQQAQGAAEILDLINEIEAEHPVVVESVSASWESELDADKNEYLELSSVELNCKDGLIIDLGVGAGTVRDPQRTLDPEVLDQLENEVQDQTSLSLNDEILALTLGKEEDTTWDRADLERLAGLNHTAALPVQTPEAGPSPVLTETERYLQRGANTLTELRRLGTPAHSTDAEWDAQLTAAQAMLDGLTERGTAARAFLIFHAGSGRTTTAFLASHILESEPKEMAEPGRASGNETHALTPRSLDGTTPNRAELGTLDGTTPNRAELGTPDGDAELRDYALTAVVTLNSVPVYATLRARSLDAATEQFRADLDAGRHNAMIRNNTSTHFEIDSIEEDPAVTP